MKVMKIVALFMILSLHIFADSGSKITKNSFQVLCYHNVVDKITDTKIMSITTDQLIKQFKWLKVNGYNIIKIDDILRAKRGEKDLPEKAVLLTFDDGYESFYTRIYPLLKLYNFSAVYALVGKWMQTPVGEEFLYGNLPRPRKLLLTWDEVNEMIKSGVIELASHSYDSHHGIIANPQGNLQPALTTIEFDPKTKRYETIYEYIKRVDSDIKRSRDVIYEHTGVSPRSIAWPYGAYNGIVQKISKKYGMDITLTLDDGINTPYDLDALKRILVGNASNFKTFYWSLQESDFAPNRSLFLDIDDIYDSDANKTNENLGKAIEKIAKMKITTVVLKAYSDADNDSFADSLYFPNNILPMKADLLNRVAWQLKSRAKIDGVYVQMPLFSFELNNEKFSFHKKDDIEKIKDIYFYMAKQSYFRGVLFNNSQNIDTLTLIRFSDELIKKMRYFTKEIDKGVLINAKTVFNLSKADIKKLLTTFDDIYIETKGLLTDRKVSKEIISKLIKNLNLYSGALEKVDFVLNVDQSSPKLLSYQVKKLLVNKAANIAYYQDDFINSDSKVDLATLIELFSLKNSPFE